MPFPPDPPGRPGQPTPEERELLGKHLAERVGDVPTCPVCGQKEWDFNALVYQAFGYPMRPPMVQMAVVICVHCFYVLQFAWKPIQEEWTGLEDG